MAFHKYSLCCLCCRKQKSKLSVVAYLFAAAKFNCLPVAGCVIFGLREASL